MDELTDTRRPNAHKKMPKGPIGYHGLSGFLAKYSQNASRSIDRARTRKFLSELSSEKREQVLSHPDFPFDKDKFTL